MDEKKLIEDMEKIQHIAGKDQSLTRKILTRTINPVPLSNSSFLKQLFFGWVIISLLALTGSFILNNIVENIFPEKTFLEFNTQATYSLNSIVSAKSKIFFVLKGTLNVFMKLSFLAFILSAAAIPGPQKQQTKGDQICLE